MALQSPAQEGYKLQSWHLAAAWQSWQCNSSPKLGSVLENTAQQRLRQHCAHVPLNAAYYWEKLERKYISIKLTLPLFQEKLN